MDIRVIGALLKTQRQSTFSYWWTLGSTPEEFECPDGYEKLGEYENLTMEQAGKILKEVISHNVNERKSEEELLEKISAICG